VAVPLIQAAAAEAAQEVPEADIAAAEAATAQAHHPQAVLPLRHTVAAAADGKTNK